MQGVIDVRELPYPHNHYNTKNPAYRMAGGVAPLD